MAADDVALAAVALQDDEVRRRVQAGDMTALGSPSLSPEETAMVGRMAAEGVEPDVAVFETSAMYEALTYCKGKLSDEVLTAITQALPPTSEEEVEGHMIRPGTRFTGDDNCRFSSPGHCDYYYHNRW